MTESSTPNIEAVRTHIEADYYDREDVLDHILDEIEDDLMSDVLSADSQASS